MTSAGLKPATPSSGNLCSIQLSYEAMKRNMCKSNNYFGKYKDNEEKCSVLLFFYCYFMGLNLKLVTKSAEHGKEEKQNNRNIFGLGHLRDARHCEK